MEIWGSAGDFCLRHFPFPCSLKRCKLKRCAYASCVPPSTRFQFSRCVARSNCLRRSDPYQYTWARTTTKSYSHPNDDHQTQEEPMPLASKIAVLAHLT